MQTQAKVGTPINIYALSEQAVTVEFGLVIDEQILQQVIGFNKLINQQPFPGFCNTVAAYSTLTVFFDPLQVIQSRLPGTDCFDKVSGYLTGLKSARQDKLIAKADTITIPVCYGGQFGQDMDEVASHTQLTAQEVIGLHSNAIYKVYMIGFIPGFAYLGGMDERLTTLRKSTPRGAVPAGAVGIAGKQTGVYPLETPGGWQIIGRTPLQLFNVSRNQPSLLKAGDEVIFKPINEQEFNRLAIK